MSKYVVGYLNRNVIVEFTCIEIKKALPSWYNSIEIVIIVCRMNGFF